MAPVLAMHLTKKTLQGVRGLHATVPSDSCVAHASCALNRTAMIETCDPGISTFGGVNDC